MKKPDYKIVLLFFAVTLCIYAFFSPMHGTNDYFLPLAKSFLHGRINIEPRANLNELVPIDGKYYVVYPPMPAIVLMPFILISGGLINQTLASVILASLGVGLFYLLVENFTKRKYVAVLITILFGFGTNFFYTSLIGSSWYFAHICAIFFLVLALLSSAKHKSPILQGFLFSFAFLSRLPVFLAFPIFIYFLSVYQKPRDKVKNILLFFLPVIAAILIFGFYNFARFGSFIQTGYSLIPGVLQEPWYKEGIFSLSYIPRQLRAIFLSMPVFSFPFPYFLPNNISMALWLTTPALLLLVFTKFKDRLSLILLLTAFFVLIPSLLHGTVGFTQFGYRFSLDFIVLLLLALIPVFERIGWRITAIFVGASVLINFWVVWLFHIGLFRT